MQFSVRRLFGAFIYFGIASALAAAIVSAVRAAGPTNLLFGLLGYFGHFPVLVLIGAGFGVLLGDVKTGLKNSAIVGLLLLFIYLVIGALWCICYRPGL